MEWHSSYLVPPQALRAALFTDEVQKNCGFHISNDRSEDGQGDPYNKWEIRGAARYNKFIKEFWESAEVSAAASDAIGMEVGPTMELELGHTNFQMPHSSMGENAVDGWHYDSNCPFVIIVMLSETEGVEGGETGFATADGAEMRIRYPGPGWAVAMQVGWVSHVAPRSRILLFSRLSPPPFRSGHANPARGLQGEGQKQRAADDGDELRSQGLVAAQLE